MLHIMAGPTFQAALQSLNTLLASRALAIHDSEAEAKELASHAFFRAANRAEESGESASPQQRRELER